jgi:hypothetical protein
MRSAAVSAIQPLSGEKRTSSGEPISVAIDPWRTWRLFVNGRCHVAKYWGRKTYIALKHFAGGSAVVLIADLGSHSTKSRCVGLLQRMCEGECINLHTGVEDLPHDRIRLKVATV